MFGILFFEPPPDIPADAEKPGAEEQHGNRLGNWVVNQMTLSGACTIYIICPVNTVGTPLTFEFKTGAKRVAQGQRAKA
jgi:hypothetical protein